RTSDLSKLKPKTSAPKLLDTMVRPSGPLVRSASMSTVGIPTSPKPPTAIEDPEAMSCTASVAELVLLSTMCLMLHSCSSLVQWFAGRTVRAFEGENYG